MKSSNFNKYPTIKISGREDKCVVGWDDIIAKLNHEITALGSKAVVVIDCYQGVFHNEVLKSTSTLHFDNQFMTADAFKSVEEIEKMVYPDVTDDRVFGFMTNLNISDFFDSQKLVSMRSAIESSTGVTIVYGEGAAYVFDQPDLLIYLDMARWEIQLRMRQNRVNNLGVENADEEFAKLYKQSFFVDWRVLDKHKVNWMDHWDYLIDTNRAANPKMIDAATLHHGLDLAVKTPFRVVPFFDPGPWGGQWLKEVVDLDRSEINFAWGFDCVPEENSLLLEIGDQVIEIPSINLVFKKPKELLGEFVYEKFGSEFPIRFDFLDTMDGGNLSLQVHPTTEYIKKHFGMEYTQDESYYMLEAKEGAFVYLGLNENVDPIATIQELKEAQQAGGNFDAEKHVKKWPIKKHDHVSIPAGTVHCSGKDSVVLEISATPYIFTFKLWDWGRLGLDGKPRPINIEHGEQVIDWSRKENWVRENILNPIEKIGEGDGWTEERTGLHQMEFIETRRHWFTKKVPHHTNGGVNVINLVEGREAIVESPSGAFQPYVIHYAETFIVPAEVGEYTIRPYGEAEGEECGTLKAYVRTENWNDDWVLRH